MPTASLRAAVHINGRNITGCLPVGAASSLVSLFYVNDEFQQIRLSASFPACFLCRRPGNWAPHVEGNGWVRERCINASMGAAMTQDPSSVLLNGCRVLDLSNAKQATNFQDKSWPLRRLVETTRRTKLRPPPVFVKFAIVSAGSAQEQSAQGAGANIGNNQPRGDPQYKKK